MKSLHSTMIVSACFLSLTAAAGAEDIHVHVDASVHGNPDFGFPPYEVFVPAGSYTCTLVQETYSAWSHYLGGTETWHTALNVRHADGTSIGQLGNWLYADTAEEAFVSTTNLVLAIDLESDEMLHFHFSDHIVWDNVGGVSVVISEDAPVSVEDASWGSVKALYR